MKPLTLLAAFILLVSCFSCKQNPPKNNTTTKPEVPKPLQDDHKDISFISKGRGENLLDGIYSDLVSKSPDLQKLADQTRHFEEGHADSLQAFKNYDSKSVEYYYAATMALSQIKDTVIRHRLRVLLTNSQKNYDGKTSKYTSWIKKMDEDQLSAADYYLTLRIAATLPVMEQYQDKNIPDSKSAEAIATEAEKLKQQTQKLAEKYENKTGTKK